MTRQLLMGNQAVALGALSAGVNLVSGYPGTPSTEVLETVSEEVRKIAGELNSSDSGPDAAALPHVEWSINEKCALEVAAGCALSGGRALVTMKQVGMNVAADPLMTLAYLGVPGGLVLYVADDPGPISSQTEQDTRQFAQFAKVPVLDPSSPEECYSLVQVAFQLSERHGTPVILRATTRVCHGSAVVDVGETPGRTASAALPPCADRAAASARPPYRDDPQHDHGRALSPKAPLEQDLAASALGRQASNTAPDSNDSGRALSPKAPLEQDLAASAKPLEQDTAAYIPHPIAGFQRSPKWVSFPPLAYKAHLAMPERHAAIALEFSDIATGHFSNSLFVTGPGAQRGIVAGGVSWAYLLDALSELGLCTPGCSTGDASEAPDSEPASATGNSQPSAGPQALRLLKLATPYPFPDDLAASFLAGLTEVLVFEELEPVLERELLRVVGTRHLPATVLGKLSGHTLAAGENSVAVLAAQLRQWLDPQAPCAPTSAPQAPEPQPQELGGEQGSEALPEPLPEPLPEALPEPPLPVRSPVLCAGCPHRASFLAVKIATSKTKATYSGDIGCYTLGNAQPLDMVDTCICMGAGFTVPQGMHWAEPDSRHLGFLGDSTFFASGMTGVANAVYNQARATFFILDNSITAMTGAQPHPGTGIRASWDAKPADAANAISIPAVLEALGVGHVRVQDPFDLEAAVQAVREAVGAQGVSAVVFKAPCITLSKPKSRPRENTQACTLCMKCVNSLGCPALVLRDDHVGIDPALCYGCGLCVQVCPFTALLADAAAEGELS